MTKKPLRVLFDAMYHNKQNFDDFATGEIDRHFTKKTIKDDAGKERLVFITDRTLRKYHSFLNLFIFNRLPVNEGVVFSYRKGTNAAAAVRMHAGSKHFYQADFSNFFGSITSDIVRQIIINGEDVLPIADTNQYLDRIVDLVTVDGRLPMGYSTSPVISNAALLLFDKELARYCQSKQLVYTRYSDDIIISSDEKEPLMDMSQVIADTLSDCDYYDLRLNEEKTKISSKGRKVKILGMVILPNGQVSLDAKMKNRIETLLHLYVNNQDRLSDATKIDFEDSVVQLSGLLNYANTIDQDYLDKLRRKYGVTVVDILIHQPKKTDSKKAE
ncbi:reverse transcriptase domain-containing protein [Paraburkholderia heleia]|uniref:reverse transcriptase domain-containing protein n=1 Tax=Paraburkholderia heleia TaxID=634127 RepID=UPI0009FC57B8|nr:reverse transcriptase domain-containing protein [Paraburkholderia heleia]